MFQLDHRVSIVRIRPSTNSSNSFEPQVITVLVGVNNTVRWVNESDEIAMLSADNDSDPGFYKATGDFVFIMPHKSFEFTFTSLGEIGYHGKPWQRGSVIVLHALPTS
jgi:plastocyanin